MNAAATGHALGILAAIAVALLLFAVALAGVLYALGTLGDEAEAITAHELAAEPDPIESCPAIPVHQPAPYLTGDPHNPFSVVSPLAGDARRPRILE